ncbi:uncharacterized protein J3D65DRAFT_628431 [Phyllosticta citribraziliensis]|uniref:Uncharacterized protein n=1 Tax=Phyllosticta citribraziliensis TaxID=989973 RepID=A0ABR1LNT7_9PEZI
MQPSAGSIDSVETEHLRASRSWKQVQAAGRHLTPRAALQPPAIVMTPKAARCDITADTLSGNRRRTRPGGQSRTVDVHPRLLPPQARRGMWLRNGTVIWGPHGVASADRPAGLHWIGRQACRMKTGILFTSNGDAPRRFAWRGLMVPVGRLGLVVMLLACTAILKPNQRR